MEALIDRTEEQYIAAALPTLSISVMKDKEDAEIFHRVKKRVASGKEISEKRTPIARLNGVYLYIMDDNCLVMTTNGELQP